MKWRTSGVSGALALGLLVAAPAAANDAAAALIGLWVADCDAWGTPAECRLEWARGHHDSLLSVRYTIEARQDGAGIFAGSGVYKLAGPALSGYWSDSNGSLHPLHATWQDGKLTTHWGSPATERGRTEYSLAEPGLLTVTDWTLTDTGWRRFMQVTYRSAPATSSSAAEPDFRGGFVIGIERLDL